jgi:HEAT repeat protein
MDSIVLRVALVVLALSAPTWAVLSLAVVVGRLRYERRRSGDECREPGPAETNRLLRRAGGRPRTEWGKWRQVDALGRLARIHHPALPGLVRPVLQDSDGRVSAAAIRVLGEVGDDWAIDVLLDALVRGQGSRSRIAAELERLAPAPGRRLLPLLRSSSPAVRFWGATLLAPYPDLGDSSLVELTWDRDPNVRAAAVETLGTRSGSGLGAALLARLEDSEWFVRVHAARSVGHVLGADAAPSLVRLLADERWWVRTAAKDALRGIGGDAVTSLLGVLTHEDAFARNGAAEVLQDIGFVDSLTLTDPRSPILERIYEAGGENLRAAAEARRANNPEKAVQAA